MILHTMLAQLWLSASGSVLAHSAAMTGTLHRPGEPDVAFFVPPQSGIPPSSPDTTGTDPDTALTRPALSDSLPYRIPRSSSLRIPSEVMAGTDSTAASAEEARPAFTRTDLLGSQFQRTGSISRGFLVGSNRDATIVSGFRLQFAGPLSDDIDVNAALTDENSPIQPEGTTQSLREVDRVSIDLTGRSFGLTLGDFFFRRSGARSGEFGPVTRKLQGIRGEVEGDVPGLSGVRTTAGVVGASSRSVYHSIVIQGQEGVQGPYRLTGRNGEQYIVVVAGSEEVSVNGERMTRGESNDYIIDYATGEVTFSSERMITSDSRIYVDFEYADRSYARNVVGADVGATVGGGAVQARFSFLQEADDPDNPVGGPLDASTLAVLRSSGNDPWKASITGIRYVGTDSATGLPKGQYALVDTLIGGRISRVLVYAPGDPSALYSATFTRVLAVPADSVGYRRIRGGQYEVAGYGTGTHLPVIFIDPPRIQRNLDAGLSARFSDVTVSAEGSRSIIDRNRLSFIDDAGDADDAYVLRLSYTPSSIRMFGMNLGAVKADVEQRYVDQRYATFGRNDPVDYARTWDIEQRPAADERRRQASLAYMPVKGIQLDAYAGSLSRSDGIDVRRRRGGVRLEDSSGSDLFASAERVLRREEAAALSGTWDRYDGGAGLNTSIGRPSIAIRHEDRTERADSADQLLQGGFRFTELMPGFATTISRGLDLQLRAAIRSEDSTLNGSMVRAFTATGGGIRSSFNGTGGMAASVDLQTRKTAFTDVFRLRGNQDTRTTLVRSQANGRGFGNGLQGRLFYEFSSQQSSRLERVFVRVARGTGQFSYLGDINGNGIADEQEFSQVRFDGDYSQILVPGETLVPVHAVKASARLRVQADDLGLQGFLGRLSAETYARVEEKSTDVSTSSVALLRLGTFLRPGTTIAGQQLLTNDVYINESDPDLSARIRVTESRGLTDLVTAPVTSYGNERSLRVRARLTSDLLSQTDAFVYRDRSLGDPAPGRNRDLVRTGGSMDLAYRLDRYWETGLVLSVSRTENIDPAAPGIADLNEQGVRFTYGLPSRGTFRVEARREEVTLLQTRPTAIIPYEMTGGRAVGRSWFLEVRADLRLTDVVQLTASYLGRVENASSIIHAARAEARAVF